MLECDATRLAISSPRDALDTGWGAIEEILAYKQDTFNPRIINVCIVVAGADYEFEERDLGNYPAFVAALAKYLAGVVDYETWWPKVISPELRLEPVTIYRRA
jgi:hypothetical protein